MFALIKRNTKIYFANKPGVIMSCFGALISFVIYIGFLQQNLVNSWQHVSHAKQLLDLWMLGGIVSIAGITTSFQALGQMVNDKENRAIDDMKLTALTPISESMAYVVSATIVSFLMQIITFAVMTVYGQLPREMALCHRDGSAGRCDPHHPLRGTAGQVRDPDQRNLGERLVWDVPAQGQSAGHPVPLPYRAWRQKFHGVRAV